MRQRKRYRLSSRQQPQEKVRPPYQDRLQERQRRTRLAGQPAQVAEQVLDQLGQVSLAAMDGLPGVDGVAVFTLCSANGDFVFNYRYLLQDALPVSAFAELVAQIATENQQRLTPAREMPGSGILRKLH